MKLRRIVLPLLLLVSSSAHADPTLKQQLHKKFNDVMNDTREGKKCRFAEASMSLGDRWDHRVRIDRAAAIVEYSFYGVPKHTDKSVEGIQLDFENGYVISHNWGAPPSLDCLHNEDRTSLCAGEADQLADFLGQHKESLIRTGDQALYDQQWNILSCAEELAHAFHRFMKDQLPWYIN